MAIPSLNFEWLHPQPLFTRPKFEFVDDNPVQVQAARIVERRALHWQGLDRWQIARLAKMRERWRGDSGGRLD